MKDLLTSPSGVKGLGLLAAGLATGGLPIWLGGGKGLALALARQGLIRAGKTEAAKKIWYKMQAMKNTMKKKVFGENHNMKKSFDEVYIPFFERDEHKKSKEYKKLSPKMRKAVDDLFKKMDSKPSDFLNSFEKSVKEISRKYKVSDKDMMKYFEKEVLTIG